MNVYETITILDASLGDDTVEASIKRIKDLIVADGGEVLKVDPWGRRKLSYAINKHSRGYYVLFLFKAPSATIKKLEGLFKVFDPVIKFIVVKLEKKQRDHALKAIADAAAAAAAAAATPAPAPAAPAAAPETPAATV